METHVRPAPLPLAVANGMAKAEVNKSADARLELAHSLLGRVWVLTTR